MKVLRVFNNNVVLSRDELGREVVITGRGVGYQKRPGQPIDPGLVVRRFVPADNPESVGQVLADIPPERLALVERLFGEAVRELGAVLPPLAVIAAADHVHQAIERVARGERIEYRCVPRWPICTRTNSVWRRRCWCGSTVNSTCRCRRARRSRWPCTCSMRSPAAPAWSRRSSSRS